jgi:NAD(P)-dependent dehydrogenase (short-subunit alcohol dehydrogenase family)
MQITLHHTLPIPIPYPTGLSMQAICLGNQYRMSPGTLLHNNPSSDPSALSVTPSHSEAVSDRARQRSSCCEPGRSHEHQGSPVLLVRNAASNPFFGPLSGLEEGVFLKIMRNNVMSILWLSNTVHPELAERRDGSVIVVSSIGAPIGSEFTAVYNMSNAADLSLIKSLSLEWGPALHPSQHNRPGPHPDRLRQAAVERYQDSGGTGKQGRAQAHRATGRHWRRGLFPRVDFTLLNTLAIRAPSTDAAGRT